MLHAMHARGASTAGPAGASGTESHATLLPTAADVTTALAAAPDAAAALASGKTIALGSMGVYSALGAPVTSIATANFQFTTATPSYLTLGLLGASASASGVEGRADARVYSGDGGMRQADASAYASTRGAAGSIAEVRTQKDAKAQSVSTGTEGVRVETMARSVRGAGRGYGEILTETNVGGAINRENVWQSDVVYAFATAAPTAASASAALAGAPQVAAALANDRIIGIGTMGKHAYDLSRVDSVATANFQSRRRGRATSRWVCSTAR